MIVDENQMFLSIDFSLDDICEDQKSYSTSPIKWRIQRKRVPSYNSTMQTTASRLAKGIVYQSIAVCQHGICGEKVRLFCRQKSAEMESPHQGANDHFRRRLISCLVVSYTLAQIGKKPEWRCMMVNQTPGTTQIWDLQTRPNEQYSKLGRAVWLLVQWGREARARQTE